MMRLLAFSALALLAVSLRLAIAANTPDISQRALVRLTYNEGFEWNLSLSGDGNRLVWAGDPKRTSQWDIVVADGVEGVWQTEAGLGKPGLPCPFLDLSDDGNMLVYDSHGLRVRECTAGVWGAPVEIAGPREWAGDYSVADTRISGDGSAMAVAFTQIGVYRPFLIRRQNGVWGPLLDLGAMGWGVAIDRHGTRACTAGTSLQVYDTASPEPKLGWTLEEGHYPDYFRYLGVSDDGRRVAYHGYGFCVMEEHCGEWDQAFRGLFDCGVLSGDGMALALVRAFNDTTLYLSRVIDGEWHEPIPIADVPSFDLVSQPPALSSDGTKIAFGARLVPNIQCSQEIFFLEYDFPGRGAVRSNIPDAPFTISGPIDLFRRTDERCGCWECDQMYASTWTVTWGDVPPYDAPPPETKSVALHQTTYFHGEYGQSRLAVDSITWDAPGVKLTWQSLPGRTYRVFCRDSLLDNWRTAGELVASGITAEWTDTSVTGLTPRLRVYMVELVSEPVAPRMAF